MSKGKNTTKFSTDAKDYQCLNMKIKNIKCSFLTNGLVKEGLKRSETFKFLIDEATIFIFGHSPYQLNVTGLKNVEDVEHYVRVIEKKYNIKCKDVKIDNIFISHKDNKNIKLSNVFYYAKENFSHLYLVDYNVELFPGMFLKPKNKKYPTIILFRTGSFQLMGGKNLPSILKAHQIVNDIIEYFVNMS